jgi:hypothetical protein
LKQFYDVNSLEISALPSGPVEHRCLKEYLSENYKRDLKETLITLTGYFDTVDLGFYLTGEDPRNHRGRRRLRTIDTESDLLVRELNFFWDNNREFISVSSIGSDEIRPLFSLHIHSKDLKVFQIKKFKKRIKKRLRTQYSPPRTEFVIMVFVSQIIGAVKRRMPLNTLPWS